jgi:hypothetical protein
MLRTITARLGVSLLAACCIAVVAASSAAAANEVKEGTFTYNETNGSAWGEVECHAKLIINKKYPSDGPNEGGKETEKCTSLAPGGKLTGYFNPGEEYHGYWESDFYHFVAPTYPGGANTSKAPSMLTIKIAKNLKSFKVLATYPAAG